MTFLQRTRPACHYCANPLFRAQQAGRSQAQAQNRFTRDHIMPRPWRVAHPPEVRLTRPLCQTCNQMRAWLGHCPAMLAVASALRKKYGFASRAEAARALLLPLPTEAASHG